jgi:hypothetical protein
MRGLLLIEVGHTPRRTRHDPQQITSFSCIVTAEKRCCASLGSRRCLHLNAQNKGGLAIAVDWCERWREMRLRILYCLLLAAALPVVKGEETKPAMAPANAAGTKGGAAGAVTPELKAALEKLELPKVKINLEEWSVDVEASVCEDYGLLEVIACLKDTRDHESVVRTEAKPSHIHTALLLLGAQPGSPAMQQMLEGDPPRFRNILPSGSPVGVFLVTKDGKGVATERPVNEFILRASDDYDAVGQPVTEENKKKEHFPTHIFVFAGSVLLPAEGDGPRRYLADTEGNIISISTFGDELLCMPGIYEKSNESLVWQADSDLLKAGPVILRLRPLQAGQGEKAADSK